MTLQVALTLVSVVIGVVAFLGLVATFLRGNADRGTILSLTNSIAAMKIEDDLKDEKIEKLKTHIAEMDMKIAHQETELETWRSAVTQAKEIQNLTRMLGTHHDEALALLTEIKKVLSHE